MKKSNNQSFDFETSPHTEITSEQEEILNQLKKAIKPSEQEKYNNNFDLIHIRKTNKEAT
jgi:hypothetical protein